MSTFTHVPDGLRPSEAVVVCSACGEPLTLPRRASNAAPFCSRTRACRSAYSKWRYNHVPGVKDRIIERVMRRRQQRLTEPRETR